MKAILLESPGQLKLVQIDPPPQPRPGEALVRVRRVGICGTDLHAYRGRQPFFTYPRIIGHELGVDIEALGENPPSPPTSVASPHLSPLRPGDRCAVEPYLHCGRCIACRRGKPNCCVDLMVLGVHTDGGLRERFIVPIDKLHRSNSLDFDQLALVETLCIAAHAVGRAPPETGESVLVVGAGPIGLAVVQFAHLAGADLTVMDINPQRLDFCRRHFNIDRCIPPPDDPVQLTGLLGELPTTVFDATGSPTSMNAAFHYVAPGGRLVFVGLVLADITFHDPHFHRREITLLASRNALPADFTRVLHALESGDIDTSPWLTHRATIDQLPSQFPLWLDPRNAVVKAVVEC